MDAEGAKLGLERCLQVELVVLDQVELFRISFDSQLDIESVIPLTCFFFFFLNRFFLFSFNFKLKNKKNKKNKKKP